MIGGTLLAAVLGIVALAFVLAPLFRGATDRVEQQTESLSELRELHAKQQMLLASLKDLEDDHATDKVSEEDYNELRSRLSAEAIEVMRALDADEQRRADEATSGTLRHPGARRPGQAR